MAPVKPEDRDQVRGFQGTISRRSILGFVPAALFLRSLGFAQALDLAKASEDKLIKARPLPLNSIRLRTWMPSTCSHLSPTVCSHFCASAPDWRLQPNLTVAGTAPEGSSPAISPDIIFLLSA